MDKFIVHKSELSGAVIISGAKNAALPVMAATILTDEKCIIRNVPDLMDIRTMIKILECLGKEINFENNILTITTISNKSFVAPYKLVRTMRASFCCLGPLLAKRKKAKVALPGGCVIGARPVDLHIKGLKALGAEINIDKGYCQAKTNGLEGAHIYLGGSFGSSVLATANVMMAAVLSKDETVIEHAACEPEIKCLGLFLKKMGADIIGEGTSLLKIKGVKKLKGCEFEVIPDRIETGTFMAASIATRSPLKIVGANPMDLISVIEVVRNMGVSVDIDKDQSIFINPKGKLKPANITTLAYPGFPTDLQAQFMACLSLVEGVSLIAEKVYPDRFMHVAELNRMGASIQKSGSYAIIEGKHKIYGAEIMASDLRASAALVIAGLAAEGKTEILRVYHIDRGYEKIENKLKKLGAKIKRQKQ